MFTNTKHGEIATEKKWYDDQSCLTVPLPSSDSLLIVMARANVKPMSRAVPPPRRRISGHAADSEHSKGSPGSAIRGVLKKVDK